MKKSSIQWTDATWNIAIGCTKVDADCKYCYMYRDSLKATRYNPLEIRRTKTVFDMPLRYKETTSQCWPGKPLLFTCSLTDFFHPEIDNYRHEAWDIIRQCPHLIFQILTKRPERIKVCLPPDWGDGWDNVWLGTSVGSQESSLRIAHLLTVPAAIRFASIEPLHGPVDLTIRHLKHNGIRAILAPTFFSYIEMLDWVIVGGESGNEHGQYTYRPCELSWIEKIVSDCKRNGIPAFVKQLGTHLSKELQMSDRHGGNIDEFPTSLRIRQFPVETRCVASPEPTRS